MSWSTKKFTGAGTIAITFNPESRYALDQVRLTLDSPVSTVEDFTLVLDSATGSEYDVQLITKAMSAVKSFIFPFDDSFMFEKNDKLVFSYANTDGRTFGLEIRFMVMC